MKHNAMDTKIVVLQSQMQEPQAGQELPELPQRPPEPPETQRNHRPHRRGGKRPPKEQIEINPFLVLCASLIAIVLAGILCSYPSTSANSPDAGKVYQNLTIEPMYLQTSGTYFSYEDESRKITSLIGVDVSTHQGEIDWKAVKEAGISFAMIRLGFRGYGNGKLVVDEFFEKNLINAQTAGIECGVYFYSQAVNAEEALEEANFVLEQLDGRKLSLPIVFDLENPPSDEARTYSVDGEQATQHALAFCEKIQEAGHQAMVYMNGHWASEMYDLEQLSDYPIWYAAYSAFPELSAGLTMWQYTNQGLVDGVVGDVDLNLLFIKED